MRIRTGLGIHPASTNTAITPHATSRKPPNAIAMDRLRRLNGIVLARFHVENRFPSKPLTSLAGKFGESNIWIPVILIDIIFVIFQL